MAFLRNSPKRLWIIFSTMLLFLCLVSVQPVQASPLSHSGYPPTPIPSPTPVASPYPPNTTPSVPGSGSNSSSGSGGIVAQIFETIVKFANDTVAEGIMFGIGTFVRDTADAIDGPIDQGINASFHQLTSTGFVDSGIYTADPAGSLTVSKAGYLWEARFQAWRGILVASTFLLPITLLATVIFAMRGGMSSFTSRSDAKEALVQWFISIALAGCSYFLLYQGFRLSEAFTAYINENLLTEAVSSSGAGNSGILAGIGIVSVIVSILLSIFTGPPGAALAIFSFFFVILGAVFIYVSIALAALAKDVILFLSVAISPLVCILSPVQPFRWLFNAWLKVAGGALLLVPGTTLLWRFGSFLVIHTLNSVSVGEVWPCIYAILLWIGIASIIVSLNFFVGKLVYAAAVEVAQKAAKSTLDTIGMSLRAAGFADGISQSAAPDFGGSGGYARWGNGNNDGSKPMASGSAPNSGPAPVSPYGKMASRLNSNPSVLSSFLKSTGLPGLADYGAGVETGLRSGQMTGRSPKPLPDDASRGEKSALASLREKGGDESFAKARIDQYKAGLNTAASKLGISKDDIVRSFGYGSYQEYFSAGAEKGHLAPIAPAPKADAPLFDSKSSKFHDIYYANQVMQHYGESLNSSRYGDVLGTLHIARTQGGDSHPNIMQRMNNREGKDENLGGWLTEENERLRMRGAIHRNG
jgi:hypothetical protein